MHGFYRQQDRKNDDPNVCLPKGNTRKENPPFSGTAAEPQKEKKFPIESQEFSQTRRKENRLKSVKYGSRPELFGINGTERKMP